MLLCPWWRCWFSRVISVRLGSSVCHSGSLVGSPMVAQVHCRASCVAKVTEYGSSMILLVPVRANLFLMTLPNFMVPLAGVFSGDCILDSWNLSRP
ncbi:hypothetical protein F4860DRAFT_468000, partial [Xylaria cubensis]